MSNDASQPATPLLVLGETRKRALESRLSKCILSWQQEWRTSSVTPPTFELEPVELPLQEVAQATYATRGRAGSVTCLFALATNSGIADSLGLPQRSSASTVGDTALVGDVANDLLSSLARCVLTEAQYQPSQVDISPTAASEIEASERLAFWWQVRLSEGLLLVVSPTLLALLAPARKATLSTPVDKRRAAIGEETVSLQAVLGVADVSVGELSSLRVNDVVVLTGSLTHPGQLKTRAGQHVANVSLGRVEGKRAVVIAKA